MSLGAQRGNIRRMIIGRGMGLAMIGVAIGWLAAIPLARVTSSFLFGVSATDPFTFVGISLLIAGVTLLATYIPARRAAKVDPLVALRYQ
jgi:putative ABC transport system permease protein